MGKRTSVYLSDELAERVKASGLAPAELMRRGLDAGEPEPLEALLTRVVRSVLDERDAARGAAAAAEKCWHRIPAGSYCKICRKAKEE